MSGQKITLQDRDQRTYEVACEIANICDTIKALMPDVDSEDEDAGAPAEQQPIPLTAVAPEHFDLIIEWCTHEVENKSSSEQEKNAWNKQYFSAMDDTTILAIITAACYLGCRALENAAVVPIATIIHESTSVQIWERFNPGKPLPTLEEVDSKITNSEQLSWAAVANFAWESESEARQTPSIEPAEELQVALSAAGVAPRLARQLSGSKLGNPDNHLRLERQLSSGGSRVVGPNPAKGDSQEAERFLRRVLLEKLEIIMAEQNNFPGLVKQNTMTGTKRLALVLALSESNRDVVEPVVEIVMRASCSFSVFDVKDISWLHQMVFSSCTQNKSSEEQMYGVANDLLSGFEHGLAQCISDDTLASDLTKTQLASCMWRMHSNAIALFEKVFEYLHRYYTPKKNLPSLRACAQSLWMKEVFGLDASFVAALREELLQANFDAEAIRAACKTRSEIWKMSDTCACAVMFAKCEQPLLPLHETLCAEIDAAHAEGTAEMFQAGCASLVTLVAKDGEHLEVPFEVCKMSETIMALMSIDLMDPDSCAAFLESPVPIPLPPVEADILRKVIEYCTYHSENADEKEDVTEAWDKEFAAVDDDTLFSLILAANYLDIKPLLDLTCKTVADYIKQCKTPQEIRRRFNIKNDFTPEEEEEVRKENAWCAER